MESCVAALVASAHLSSRCCHAAREGGVKRAQPHADRRRIEAAILLAGPRACRVSMRWRAAAAWRSFALLAGTALSHMLGPMSECRKRECV